MRIFDNPNQIPQIIIKNRLSDDDAIVFLYDVTKEDEVTLVHYVGIESVLSSATIESALSQVLTQAEQTYISDGTLNKAQIRTEYQNMITRLEQIQNAGSISFTQAGFNLVVQANKDQALFIERIMKFIARQ